MRVRIADRLNHWAGLVMIVFAIVGGAIYYVQLQEQGERARCQSEVNAAVSANIKIRSQITQRSDEAQSALLAGVGKLVLNPVPVTDIAKRKKTGEEYMKLFRAFNKAADEVEAARAANPVPDIRECR